MGYVYPGYAQPLHATIIESSKTVRTRLKRAARCVSFSVAGADDRYRQTHIQTPPCALASVCVDAPDKQQFTSAMELLSSSRQDAVRMIREQLCCMLWVELSVTCLDCKHNFCRECIFGHLKKNTSSCPTCHIPIFPSEIMRNQFLQSILVAWKAVELELKTLETHKQDFPGLTVDDMDRALTHMAGGASQLILPVPMQPSSSTSSAAAGTSTPSATGMSRGPVANSKWNIDTKSILNEQKQPKRMTGVASSPMRSSSTTATEAHAKSPGPTQMTQMTPSSATQSTVHVASPVAHHSSRRWNVFSPSQSLSQLSSSSQMDSSLMVGVMPTQEVESYMERIQQQNKILREWEQGRQLASQQQQQRSTTSHSQCQSQKRLTLPKSTPSKAKKPDISAMEKLMKNWMSNSTATSSQLSNAAASSFAIGSRTIEKKSKTARSLSAMIDAEENDIARKRSHPDDDDEDYEDEDEGSQTQMPSMTMDSPDLLALSANNGYPLSRLDEFNRTGVIGGSAFSLGGIESAVSRRRSGLEEASHSANGKQKQAKRQVVLSSPPRTSLRKRAVSVPNSRQLDDEEDEDDGGEEMQRSEEDTQEVDDSQPLPGASTRLHYDTYSRSAYAVNSGSHSQSTHADVIAQRRKKLRASDDFEGAITVFHSKQKTARPGDTVQPVACLALSSLKSPKGILNATVMRNASVGGTPLASPGAGMLSPTPTSRPPLAQQSNSARQLIHELRASRNFTLISTDLDRIECKKIVTACSLLGGRFGPRFDLRPDPVTGVLTSTVTHLIAKSVPPVANRRCKRTAKYMRALAEGCIIVDYSWVQASLDAGKWLHEDGFEILGDAYSDSVGKPHESHLRRIQTGRRNDIFQMFRFVLLCDETEFDWQVGSLRGVVENFGATVISEAKYLCMSEERKAAKTQVGIVSKCTTPVDAKDRYEQHQIPIVRVTWIFDSISHLEVLPFDEYYPY
ncbi:Pih1d3 protein, partial [Globisporangium splendens]